MLLLAGVLLVVGAGCAHFFLRYGTARLVLDDDGFRLEGPLLTAVTVRWAGVTEYRVRPGTPGPATLTLTRAEGDRLTVPLIYEEAYLLELGLGQRGFPRF